MCTGDSLNTDYLMITWTNWSEMKNVTEEFEVPGVGSLFLLLHMIKLSRVRSREKM